MSGEEKKTSEEEAADEKQMREELLKNLILFLRDLTREGPEHEYGFSDFMKMISNGIKEKKIDPANAINIVYQAIKEIPFKYLGLKAIIADPNCSDLVTRDVEKLKNIKPAAAATLEKAREGKIHASDYIDGFVKQLCLTFDLKWPERCKDDLEWPQAVYRDYVASIKEPGLFPILPAEDPPETAGKMQRLQSKLERAGFPEFRLNAALTEAQEKRLFEYAKAEAGLFIFEAFIEIMAGGLTPANKKTWFWFVNVFSFVVFHENQKERESAEAAANEQERREQKAKVIINGLRRTADLFGIQPPSLSAEWTGEKSFAAIQRRRGFKMDMSVYQRILHQTQLREDGFEKIENADGMTWEKKFGRRRVRLYTSKIIAGDLARRAAIAPILIASARGTYKPGPILFGEILDMIGQKECSQEERARIREYLLAGEKTSLTVIETNHKTGKETWHDYAPLYKRFRWEGGTEGAARLFPIFNEDFPEVWKATRQYAYISADRMKGLPKERTEREHFILDFFRARYGMKCISRKMKAFLLEDAQLSESILKEWGIKKIKKTVSEWFELAKAEGLTREYYIDESGGRAEYMGQVIRYYPTRGAAPRIFPREAEIRPLLNDIIEWIYEPDNKQYVKMPEAQAGRELRNAIRELGVSRIREIWEGTGAAREGEDYSPWYPGTSRYMDFWNAIRADLAAQKAEGGDGK